MTKKGFTLIEVLIYIGVFIFISTVIVSLIISIMDTSRRVSPVNALSRTAVSSFEAITRTIRGAEQIDVSTGAFDTTRFYLEDGVIKISENGVYTGPLSASDATVTALTFSVATSTKYNLVSIDITATAGAGENQKTETFSTAVRTRVDN